MKMSLLLQKDLLPAAEMIQRLDDVLSYVVDKSGRGAQNHATKQRTWHLATVANHAICEA